ncbi:MAG TPA: hypothetical protein VHU84_05170 [Lacipirellulaceae bacterium]|nr:hypothetical protein [Lacipirellulaceae bacterium]
MTIQFSIPKSLDAFVPTFEWLSNVAAEDLNEDLDTATIQQFLQSRYGNLDDDKFEKRWESDQKTFNTLLDTYGEKHSWLYYFEAFLLSAPHIIANDQSADVGINYHPTQPPLKIHVELPPNFTTENEFGSIRASGENVKCEIVPTAPSAIEYKLKNLHQRDNWEAEAKRPRFAFTEVHWGAVSGWKVVTGATPNYKSISYLLKVPGGACFANVHFQGANSDESLIEHSLSKAIVEATEQPR